MLAVASTLCPGRQFVQWPHNTMDLRPLISLLAEIAAREAPADGTFDAAPAPAEESTHERNRLRPLLDRQAIRLVDRSAIGPWSPA